MSMSVTLYQGSKVNGSTRMGLWGSLNDQRDYFNSLSKVTYSTGTVKLGEPLRINESINNLMSYDYGNIDYGDGFRYYFSIADMQMVTESLTDIYYIVDAYETLVKQKPFNYGRAHITRYPSRLGKPMLTYEPSTIIDSTKQASANQPRINLVAIAWVSTVNAYKTIVIPETNTYNIHPSLFFNGDWFKQTKPHFSELSDMTESDIILASVVYGNLRDYETPINDIAIYPWLSGQITVDITDLFGSRQLSSNETHIDVIKDARGNVVYTCPIGQTTTLEQIADLYIGLSSMKVVIDHTLDEWDYIQIPCENVSWVVDSFAEYNARQRESDKELRQMQTEKTLVDGLLASAENMAFGSILGGGKKGGAIAGGGGIVSAFGQMLTSTYYGEREQDIIDKTYRYANDMLINMGDFSYQECIRRLCGIYRLNYDADVSNQNDIAVNGYPVSFPVDDFDNYITTGKIQADIEILNISNQSWKEQIQARFINGVMLV